MARKTATSSMPRKPRLLWANPYCLLDTSSGASMSVREMLRQLVAQGYEIRILGCTIFDNPKGAGRLQQLWQGMPVQAGQFFEAIDGEISHQLLVTTNTFRDELNSREENAWLAQYMYILDSFKPDVVWFYGGYTLDLLIANEARARGIPSAFYLVNGNYQSTQRWCRDIDLILTDSQNTANLYRQKMGFVATPIGKFIDPARFVAERHERRHLLFVNPSWEKGAAIVVQLALMLEQQRPDITLEVVEARADWSALLQEVTGRLGAPRTALDNVVVTGNTSDMRPVYQRARVLLTPSLWWESGARVLAEAMLNGIPAIVSNHGGSPGLIGDGGIVLDFPPACHEAPYQYIPSHAELQPLFEAVVAFYDDQALYEEYVARAERVGREQHHISVSTRRLSQALAPLVNQKAGNKDFLFPQRKQHKHHLAGIAARPEHLHQAQSAAPRAPQPAVPGEMNLTLSAGEPLPVMPSSDSRPPQSLPLSGTPAAVPGAPFDWDLAGQVVVLDNRASLLRQGAALKLLETGAFAMLAFDPASEVQNPAQHADNPNLQIFPHALLGDGQPATLHACLDAAMSSTLAPLPAERLPEALHQGATVLTRLPIDTIALDSIEGLPSLDWLVLDALSDTLGILEHGQRALQQALLIQARVSFQATHEGQCTLQQLRDRAERLGFHFLRLNAPQYRSLSPAADGFSSQLESAEALLIPGEERLAAYPAASRKKLAFLLHAVFDARDAVCRVLQSIDPALCSGYLQATAALQPTQQPAPAKVVQAPVQTPSNAQAELATFLDRVRQAAAPAEPLKSTEKGIFIDCGGYDGCSAIKFSINNPGFDIVTFEPNPTLWPYYDGLPTRLIKKAAYTYDGEISFTIDDVDEDGSSLIQGKRIDFTGRKKNSEFQKIKAECMDLAAFIDECSAKYDKIVLKLDVEGAEYDILERIMRRGVARKVSKLYCEFHWHKCGIPEIRHKNVVKELARTTRILDWDALDFSVHKRSAELSSKREAILRAINSSSCEESPSSPEFRNSPLNSKWGEFMRSRKITIRKAPRLKRNASIFTIGSCFAEEIRKALTGYGVQMLPEYEKVAVDHDKFVIDTLPGRPHMNFYNSATILQEFMRSAGEISYAEDDFWEVRDSIWKSGGKIYQDPYKRLTFGRSPGDLRNAIRMINEKIDFGIRNASAFVITYGMSEVFVNPESGFVVSQKPLYGGGGGADTQMKILSVEENKENILKTIEIIRRFNKGAVVFASVSPVALERTFSGQDIYVANKAGKSKLRAALDEISESDKGFIYFPSYEMVESLGEAAFEADGRHVRPDVVRSIIGAFMKAYMED